MDEMQRREAYEALQRNHRQDWLKQVGLKPLDTKPLPQLIAESNTEDSSVSVGKDEAKSYEIPQPESDAGVLMFQFDTYSAPTREEAPAAEYAPPQPPPTTRPSPQPTTPSPPAIQTRNTPSVALKQELEPTKSVAATKSTAREDFKASEKQKDSEAAEAKEAQPIAEPELVKQQEEFQKTAEAGRADLRERAKADLANDQNWKVGKGNGFDARRFGGMMPNIFHGANPEDVASAVVSFSDSNGAFAAAVVQALTAVTNKLIVATQRLDILERMNRDGAS